MDMRGKSITTYILYHVSRELAEQGEGDVLEILTDRSEAIENDMRAWCRMTGHTLLDASVQGEEQCFRIKKEAIRQQIDGKVAVVVSNAGLEELLSPLGFALGAALSGAAVSVYLQGPAVRVLKRGFKAHLPGIMRVFSGFARKGMADTGHISAPEKLAQLRELGAKIYMCGPSMQHFKVRKDELIFDDVIVAALRA